MVGALDDAECSVDAGQYTNLSLDEKTQLYKIDYGVIASANDTYYGADPRGVYTFDDVDAPSNLAWSDAPNSYPAAEHCATTGGRLPGPLTLKAKYDLDGTAGGFGGFGVYWSYLESPSDSSRAYSMSFGSGGIYSYGKTSTNYVRCVH